MAQTVRDELKRRRSVVIRRHIVVLITQPRHVLEGKGKGLAPRARSLLHVFLLHRFSLDLRFFTLLLTLNAQRPLKSQRSRLCFLIGPAGHCCWLLL